MGDDLRERVLGAMAELEKDENITEVERQIKMDQHKRSLDKLAVSEQRRFRMRQQEQQRQQNLAATRDAQLERAATTSSGAIGGTSSIDTRSSSTRFATADDKQRKGSCIVQ